MLFFFLTRRDLLNDQESVIQQWIEINNYLLAATAFENGQNGGSGGNFSPFRQPDKSINSSVLFQPCSIVCYHSSGRWTFANTFRNR